MQRYRLALLFEHNRPSRNLGNKEEEVMALHHHDAGSEASGAAAWMMAMVLTAVVAVALIVALFVWAPWDDNTKTNTAPGDRTVPENQASTSAPQATQQPLRSP